MSTEALKGGFKNQDPPFWVAWHQALASIRVRFLRQAITSSGIALGIAFFASVHCFWKSALLSDSLRTVVDPPPERWLSSSTIAFHMSDRRHIRKVPFPSYLGAETTNSELRRGYPGDENERRSLGLRRLRSG